MMRKIKRAIGVQVGLPGIHADKTVSVRRDAETQLPLFGDGALFDSRETKMLLPASSVIYHLCPICGESTPFLDGHLADHETKQPALFE